MADQRYARDFFGWTLEQAEAATLKSRYGVLLAHLLKWQHQPALRSKSWRNTIRRERREIPDHLADNLGLKPKADALFAAAYRLARADAEDETDLPLATFPEDSPFTRGQALEPDVWPE